MPDDEWEEGVSQVASVKVTSLDSSFLAYDVVLFRNLWNRSKANCLIQLCSSLFNGDERGTEEKRRVAMKNCTSSGHMFSFS